MFKVMFYIMLSMEKLGGVGEFLIFLIVLVVMNVIFDVSGKRVC